MTEQKRTEYRFDIDSVNTLFKLIRLSQVTLTDLTDHLQAFRFVETKDPKYKNDDGVVFLTPEPRFAEKEVDEVLNGMEQKHAKAFAYAIGKLLSAGISLKDLSQEDVTRVSVDVLQNRVPEEELKRVVDVGFEALKKEGVLTDAD